MSENIAHVALLEDALRLIQTSPSLTGAFRETARTQAAACRLGSITRWGDRFTVGLLERIRGEWPDPEKRTEAAKRLAFVLGWLSHRAADRQVKPLIRQVEPEPERLPRESTIYHDAAVYRNVFQGRSDDPYLGVFDGQSGQPIDREPTLEAASRLAQTLLQAQLIRLHTLIPEPEDVWAWIGNVTQRVQKFNDVLPRYAAAILAPDPDKWRSYVEEPNYYDGADPIVAEARQLHEKFGLQVPEGAAEVNLDSLLAAPVRGHYGEALQLGLTYTRAASRFFDEAIDADALHEAFKIGVPGRDGLGV